MSIGKRIEDKRKEAGISQGELSKRIGVSRPSVSQWEADTSKPKGDNLLKLASALSTTADFILYGKDAKRSPSKNKGEVEFLGGFDLWDSGTPLDEDEVEVPFYSDVELSAGAGRLPVRENDGPKLRFSRATLRRYNVHPDLAACAKVRGNSMEPAIPDGATIGIDTGHTEIKDGDIFAINHHDELRVKVLYKHPSQQVRLRSFNSDEWPEETHPAKDIKVLGRVFWWSVLR